MSYPTSITFSDAPATVTLDDGTTYQATMTGTATPAPAVAPVAPPMLIGSDRLPGPDVKLYPRNRYFRLYSPKTAGIKPLPAPRGLLYHVSFKDSPTAALVNGWLKTLPTRELIACPRWQADFDVLLEWNHEPEGDMTSVAYLSGVRVLKTLLATWNAAHPDGPTVGLAQTFTGFAQVHTGKLMTDGVAATIKNLWCDADVLGVDMERDTVKWPNGFTDPEVAFGWIRDVAKILSVPYVIAEFGDAGPTTGLAGRYTACLGWFAANDCAAVGVYDTPGSTAIYTLTGDALAAVQAAIAGQGA
jgi:hypothetical protein